VYKNHGRLDGRWLDVVIVERVIDENLKVTGGTATPELNTTGFKQE
jgi:hypothetical protein